MGDQRVSGEVRSRYQLLGAVSVLNSITQIRWKRKLEYVLLENTQCCYCASLIAQSCQLSHLSWFWKCSLSSNVLLKHLFSFKDEKTSRVQCSICNLSASTFCWTVPINYDLHLRNYIIKQLLIQQNFTKARVCTTIFSASDNSYGLLMLSICFFVIGSLMNRKDK